jgi:hypothetical protein
MKIMTHTVAGFATEETFEQVVEAGVDAYLEFAVSCERTVAPGSCTGCGGEADELIPWSGQRLCWNCTDAQLDLIAKAVLEDEDTPVQVGGYGLR